MNGSIVKIIDVNVNEIIPNRFQPRRQFDEDEIIELSESIRKYGLIQPLVVRPTGDKYEIIAGERRYKASVLAGLEYVPVIVKNLTDKDSAELAIIENIQRRNLSAIEEALSYKKVLDMGYLTQEDLASKIGKSQPTIANKIRLLNLSDEIQEALLENKISERHARSLLRLTSEKEQNDMLDRIINERLTVRKTDEEIDKRIEELESGEIYMNQEIENVTMTPMESVPASDIFGSVNDNSSVVPETLTQEVTPQPEFTMPQMPEITPQPEVPVAPAPVVTPQPEFIMPQMPEVAPQPEVPVAPAPVVTPQPEFTMPQMPEVTPQPEVPVAPAPVVAPQPEFTMPQMPEVTPLNSQDTLLNSVAEVTPTVPQINMPTTSPIIEQPEVIPQPVEVAPQPEITQGPVIVESFPQTIPEPVSTTPEPIIVTDYSKQYDPVMPEAPQPISKVEFKEVIDAIRECSSKIEKFGYVIDVEEYDLANLYQVVFKIEK